MLRTDLFKTLDRAETRFIAVRDSLTKADPKLDVRHFDAIHCKRGKLGIGWHFLILVDGDIQLARDIKTCGSHSRNLDQNSVSVGIVGGTDEEGNRAYTRTEGQLSALSDLIAVLMEMYPEAEVHDLPTTIPASP